MGRDCHPRVQGLQGFGRRRRFGAAHIAGLEQDLALQVGQADRVVIHQAQHAHPRCGQIERQGAAQPARADNQYPCSMNFGLADAANLPQHNVAGIALQFFVAQGHDLNI